MKKNLFVFLLVLPALVWGNHLHRLLGSSASTRIMQDIGYRASEITESLNHMGQWIPINKNVNFYRYDDQDMIDSLQVFEWDGAWEHEYTGITTYISPFRISRFSGYTQEGVEHWRCEGIYNDDGHLTDMYAYSWFGGEPGLICMMRIHILYLPGNNYEVYIWDNYEDRDGGIYYRNQFTFDAQGRIVETLTHSSTDSLTWEPDDKMITEYHSMDTSTGEIFLEYISRYMVPNFMQEDFFEFQMISTDTEYDWEEGYWQLSDKEEYLYDGLGKLTQRNSYYYMMEQWRPNHRRNYHYNESTLNHYIEQYYSGEQWFDSRRMDYLWEAYTSVEDGLQSPALDLDFVAGPNPFADKLWIHVKSGNNEVICLDIYNLKGQKIRSMICHGQDADWDGRDENGKKAPAGIYFLRARQRHQERTRRVMKF